mmetsp:Transcript_15478/g.33364  ORF Transcript_15478/g.33364 Transcript_15478/m.33364 type:complete len:463 (+) Transcript_15478:635-2023(+)
MYRCPSVVPSLNPPPPGYLPLVAARSVVLSAVAEWRRRPPRFFLARISFKRFRRAAAASGVTLPPTSISIPSRPSKREPDKPERTEDAPRLEPVERREARATPRLEFADRPAAAKLVTLPLECALAIPLVTRPLECALARPLRSAFATPRLEALLARPLKSVAATPRLELVLAKPLKSAIPRLEPAAEDSLSLSLFTSRHSSNLASSCFTSISSPYAFPGSLLAIKPGFKTCYNSNKPQKKVSLLDNTSASLPQLESVTHNFSSCPGFTSPLTVSLSVSVLLELFFFFTCSFFSSSLFSLKVSTPGQLVFSASSRKYSHAQNQPLPPKTRHTHRDDSHKAHLSTKAAGGRARIPQDAESVRLLLLPSNNSPLPPSTSQAANVGLFSAASSKRTDVSSAPACVQWWWGCCQQRRWRCFRCGVFVRELTSWAAKDSEHRTEPQPWNQWQDGDVHGAQNQVCTAG